ncbi:MAG: hypothetical protein ABI761_06715 [Saprospiraceae bacterium]
MKNIILLVVCLISFCELMQAQSLQFAVVRPNGTTYICPTLDSAYNLSLDGDFLYLPGGSYGLTQPITKSIHIYGAGIHSDSSAVTTRTILDNISLVEGASNGSITGCYFITGGYNVLVQGLVNNYSITYCFLAGGIKFNVASNNFIITSNIVGSFGDGCLYGGSWSIQLAGQGHLISNNFIKASISSNGGNVYRNNIISYCSPYCSTLNCSNEEFDNNIIACAGSGVNNSFFHNNIGWTNGLDSHGNQGYNNYTISGPIDSLFINYTAGWDEGNIHLVPNSPYMDAGTDGTELGIYGGMFPTSEGWVPKNPHIYFKDIDQLTGPDGKLHIQVGVRTTN